MMKTGSLTASRSMELRSFRSLRRDCFENSVTSPRRPPPTRPGLCFVPKVREQNAPFLAAERTGPSYRGLICAVDKPGTSEGSRSVLSVGWGRLLEASKGGRGSFVGQNRPGGAIYRGDSLFYGTLGGLLQGISPVLSGGHHQILADVSNYDYLTRREVGARTGLNSVEFYGNGLKVKG